MGKKETPLQNQIMVALSADGHYVERIQSGLFLTEYGGRVRIGFPGRSDIGGCRKSDARAFFIEVKADGRASKEQVAFIGKMRERGALAGIARSVDEARQILDGWLSPLK